jgi:CheY-like chemotaxis protein
MYTETDLLKQVRQALNHLYDRDFLRKSPLVGFFGLSSRADPPSVLQRLLLDCIESLKPLPTEPARSEKRNVYEIILYRYVQQFTQEEVAHHVGVSERQFRREQDRAIDYLTEQLLRVREGASGATGSKAQPDVEKKVSQDEWAWLCGQPSERIPDLKVFIKSLLSLMETVASQHKVELNYWLPDTSPDLTVHPIALRQILLNLFQVAIYHAAEGKVLLRASCSGSFSDFYIEAESQQELPQLERYEQEANLLQIAARLAQISGGQLRIQENAEKFSAVLSLPLVEGICVLVIDDHPEIIDLLKRYSMGTRYRIVGINDPERAIDFAEATSPQMIVIDVMMPKVDGWELLGRLRSHPKTASIPTIVMTILAQEELALSLGAKALIVKPVTQERFLAVLDEVFERWDSGSR